MRPSKKSIKKWKWLRGKIKETLKEIEKEEKRRGLWDEECREGKKEVRKNREI